MTDTPLPYFFDEADIASIAKQPGDREKALNLSLADLKWLKTVYLANHQARTAASETNALPMHVSQLNLSIADKADIPLAGAFAMSRPNNGEVTLYTPWKGLSKFADMADLKSTLKKWLAEATGKRELLRYLSIEQRSTLPASVTPEISTREIEGGVFKAQEHDLLHNQGQNIQAMIGELVKTPTLQSMLDEALKVVLFKAFPTLDQRHTRMKTMVSTGSAIDGSEQQDTRSTLSLSDALLHYYLHNGWPAGDSRLFTHPKHRVSSDADNHTWETAIKEVAHSFTPHLDALIETFWNSSMSNGRSRSDFFCEAMRDAYHLALLLQRQKGVLTAKEFVRLNSVSLASAVNPLRIDQVRITAPFKHYAQLASTLMIGGSDTLGYLYTHCRGIEATSDLPAIKNILLEMLKSEGHEDTLLNFMSLDERQTFLALPPAERTISGQPLVHPVFESLMADIRDKQLQNLRYGLSRYRESAGMLDPHALLDNALDVRGLIHEQLLTADAAGRWSTHVDRRWSAQPATVRAESAKQQLALLATVEQALEQRLAEHPSIPSTTPTIADALPIVSASLQSLQADVTHTLSTALRSEFKLRSLARMLKAGEQAIIQTVLDNPVRLQRAALNGFLPDVFSLALRVGSNGELLKLASCFVLTERGGLDPLHSGRTIIWTPALGFEAFPSLGPLLSELKRRLKSTDERTTLLQNLARSERLPTRAYSLAPLQRIDGHFLDHVQKSHVQLDGASVTAALATKLPGNHLSSLLNLVALRQPQTGLDTATEIAQSLTTQEKLPAWLTKASTQDQVLHAELLQQYLDNVTDDKDYLSGLSSLARTAHRELEKRLNADTYRIDPDKIQIIPRLLSGRATQTLTNFALSHFHEVDQARFKLMSLDTLDIPQGMDESYIKALIKKLDLGKRQQQVLNEAFTGNDAAQRKSRFARQLPWQLLLHAHTEKLQERLSETGFDLVRQIMSMPDATARAEIDGAHAIIRPLELSGIKSEQTIKVPGIWLIGKKDNSGRQVLIAPCSPKHGLREYENETFLLTELKALGGLRDWALTNLSPADRTLCKEHLTSTSEKSADIGLASSPVKGKLFNHLFKDNADLLARLLGCQSDTDNQSEWATIKHVLGEDLDQAYTFVMGKLSYPITVWRSYRDIKQSAEDLQTHKWEPAIKEFISGIAQLAGLRLSIEGDDAAGAHESGVKDTSARVKWQDIDITAPERTHLLPLEKTDVDLSALTLDAAQGLYTDPATDKRYGAVEGKVYAVEKLGTRWRIGDDKKYGPYVKRNEAKQWVADLKTPTPRFNMDSRLRTAISIWNAMNVEADGMSKIRSLFPVKARAIDQALDLATTYAWNSFRNLQLLKNTTITPVHQIVTDFLDVPSVLPAYVAAIEKVVTQILAALLDPTLRKPKSRRFVVGKMLQDENFTYGFVAPRDSQQKIYLAQKFFLPYLDHYRNYLTDPAFPIREHARAVTLIHELSHLHCDTEDIAYLDANRPFYELIETFKPIGKRLKDALKDLQDKGLSNQTPQQQLFAIYNADTGLWEDLGQTSYEKTDQALARVLKVTGEITLADARKRFKRDPLVRLAVQLANADSVAWLITHLGRKLHVTTP